MDHLSLDFHMTHFSDCLRMSIVSVLSSSSIESHIYAVFFVSPSSCSSEESHTCVGVGEGSETSQIPVMYFCDHSFSKSMTD